jgi:hypothetical protein
MLLDSRTLERITRGEVTLAFRRWRRPTVRSGGTLLTAAGQLEIVSVTPVELDAIGLEDIGRAGFGSREALLDALGGRDGEVYRIELGTMRPDPRVALRESALDEPQLADLVKRLGRLDAASPDGPWTSRTLRVIRDHPAVRAADLCALVVQDLARRRPFPDEIRGCRELTPRALTASGR